MHATTAPQEPVPEDMVFRPGALPELFVPGAWDDDDDRYYVPLGPGVGSKPLWMKLHWIWRCKSGCIKPRTSL